MEMPLRRNVPFSVMVIAILALLFLPPHIAAQQPAAGVAAQSPASEAGDDASTSRQMADILRTLGEMRQELHDSHQQVDELKKEVKELREEVAAGGNGSTSAEALKEDVDQLKEDQEVVQSQVKTLQQSKIETASKYPLSITGMVLFNSFVVDGSVDSSILPLIALPRTNTYVHHSLGASLRQTQFGVHTTGPRLWNAQTSADLTADFFDQNGYTSIGYTPKDNLHLRNADVVLNWTNTQVTAGLETPLVSLLSPTSFATVAAPSLAWSGNLWTWLPQITVEQHLKLQGSSHAVFGLGLLDPTTDDITGEQTYGIRRQSLQPSYEGRAAYEWGDPQRQYELGINGYSARQRYFGAQTFTFWAGTADWRVPLGGGTEFSGEFYRGRGIGDLGGGAFKDIVTNYEATGNGHALDSTGGWAQFKARFNPVLEANLFFGEDSANADELQEGTPVAASTASPYLYLARNRSFGANLIYRPKSYLIFSGEYRNLRSWYVLNQPSQTAGDMTLTMGYLF